MPPKKNYVKLNAKYRARIQNGETTFNKAVSKSKFIAKLLTALKKHQQNVWIKTFENTLEFQAFFDTHVKSLGLTSTQSDKWNNKVEQYRQFEGLVPIADFIITSSEETVNYFKKLASSKGIITSLPRGEQGSGIRLHTDKASFQGYLSQMKENKLIVMTALSVKSTLCINILIANKEDIFVYGLAEQISDGFVSLGCAYPTTLSEGIVSHCYGIANKIGLKLAKEGIKGIVGIDLIIDEDDRVYFCELNARIDGTTHNRMLALEQALPSSNPSLVDLEIMALEQGTLNGYQLPSELKDVFWYKKEIYAKCSGKIRRLNILNDSLQLAQLGKGAVIVGQRKEGFFAIKDKTSLGNLICIGRTKEELDDSIRSADTLVQQYIPIEGTVKEAHNQVEGAAPQVISD